MKIDRLDHLVLTVLDFEKTLRFYSDILGMKLVRFGGGRRALHFGDQKINLHREGEEIKPHARTATPGSADICFLTQTPVGEVAGILKEHNIDIIQGPVERYGALGKLVSVYFRDPDGNLLEVSNYKNEVNDR